jgi:Gpi18-like mannosyltransferase
VDAIREILQLKEIAIDGVLVSPILIYALISIVLTLILRYFIYKVVNKRFPWHEAWFDISLFLMVLVLITFIINYKQG